MKHLYKPGQPDHPVLFMLHGTGGDEHDLLPIANHIDSDAAILSVRGDVSENGMNRFFKRLYEGVFDIDDLIMRTDNMVAFLTEAAQNHGFELKHLVAVGYSNGANLAGSLLFHHGAVLTKAVLMHPMVPRKDIILPDLTGVLVLVTAGINDPLCPKHETKLLVDMLSEAGADVTLHWFAAGHQLSAEEIDTVKKWVVEHA
ncbi:MAG: alpha/beta hydrolase [Acholeplasmatales bacterium]|nr:MAG: alpha/beta hydrolase [Acholeplasmatales bacterium]